MNSESLTDTRNLEVHLEDLFGRLRLLRQEKPTCAESHLRRSEQLMELSDSIRETSMMVRRRSEAVRAGAVEHR